MAKEGTIEVEGKVIEKEADGYIVVLSNGHTVKAHVSGKMQMNVIRVFLGDTVVVELSPYDLTRGRIIYRK